MSLVLPRRGMVASLWLQTWAGAGNSLFLPPQRADNHSTWLDGLHTWRTTTRLAANLTGESEVYEMKALAWTQTSYVQPQVHTFDRMLWNESSAQYTVDRYLDDCNRRYGGIDSVSSV